MRSTPPSAGFGSRMRWRSPNHQASRTPPVPVTLTVPLKGRRRALGTLVLTGVRPESGGDADLLARAEQVGRGLAASLENVQLLDDVLRSAERLAHTEKVLALGQFVAGVAHELNNPLQGVLGHLELMRASPSLPPSLKRDLGLVYREADRAARIVRNLLVFAGSGRLRTRSMNLNLLAGRVLRLRARALDRARIDVVREFDASLPLVKADGLLLQQAVLNVVLNAEQAMDGQPGRLVVRTERDRGATRRGWWSRTRVPAWATTFARGCSSRSSQRRKSGRGRGLAWRSPSASCKRMAGPSKPTIIPTAERGSS